MPVPIERRTHPDPAGATRSPSWLIDALRHERAYLLRFARRRQFDNDQAEDVVQDTLLSAWRDGSRFAHRSSLRTWLTAILRRRLADALRKQRRDLASSAEWAVDPVEGPADDESRQVGPDDAGDPQRLLEGRQALADLLARVASMPAREAQLIEMRTMGHSNEEAAQQLGMTPGQSALMTHRVRSKLRRHANDVSDEMRAAAQA